MPTRSLRLPGLETLKIIARGQVIPEANENAQNIRNILNEVITRHEINWCAHGEHSIVHILMNHQCPKQDVCDRGRCTYDYRLLYKKDPPLLTMFRSAMLGEGVDSVGDHWWISRLHKDGVVGKTGEAFDQTIKKLKESLPDRF